MISRFGSIGKTVWLLRHDIRDLCQHDPERFDWWLANSGIREYAALAEAECPYADDFLATPWIGALASVTPTLTLPMWLTWKLRPDLQAAFDLADAVGQRGLVLWSLTEGITYSPLMARVARVACRNLLDTPSDRALSTVHPPLTKFMEAIMACRPDLQAAFNIDNEDDQQNYVWWYFTHGLIEQRLAAYVTTKQKRLLNSTHSILPGDSQILITRLMHEIWLRRLNFVDRIPVPMAEREAEFAVWYYKCGAAELGLLDLVDDSWADTPRPLPARDVPVAAPAIHTSAYGLPDGVNLVGSARGQFGIGEEVRMTALALQEAKIPCSIYNVPAGPNMCEGDRSAEDLINDALLPYSTTLFCLTGIETARLAAVHGSKLFNGNHRIIGYWPWEMQEWPAVWSHAYDLVDEVWAASRFTYDAFIRSSHKPVSHVPSSVAVDGSAGLTRQSFGLASDKFLFIFSFDVLSSLARKNPWACINAFLRAFPTGDEPVGLVVKAMRPAEANDQWQALLAYAETDRRITIIGRTLEKREVLDLYRACDCFISLHRAEGFGRGIAEAMMLGKPVIVTGYSGNMDFTHPLTAALVDYRFIQARQGEYQFGEGQWWAEPDVEHAAWWMRRIVSDHKARARIAGEARRLMSMEYLPSVAGARFAMKLGMAS